MPQAGPPPKRSRTNISLLGGRFIDEYLQTYIGLRRNATGRKKLIATILDAAKCKDSRARARRVPVDGEGGLHAPQERRVQALAGPLDQCGLSYTLVSTTPPCVF